MEEVEHRTLEIVDELVSKHQQWVTFELLVSILLDRYSVNKLEDLGVNQIESVRTLHLVLELNRKLNVFLNLYSGSRGIITLLNLETDACDMLKAFHYPTIVEIKRNLEAREQDPNEIGIGLDQSASTSSQISRIADFGLGELQRHPIVANMFPTTSVLRREQMKSTGAVLVSIAEYLQRIQHFDEEEDPKVKESIDIGELSNFLLEERWTEDNYDSLAMAGVRLEHVGTHEILACKFLSTSKKGVHVNRIDNTAVDTAVGIMRSKRLYETQKGDTSSPPQSTKKTRNESDNPTASPVELSMTHHTETRSGLVTEEIATGELKELCFSKEWANDQKLKDRDRDQLATAGAGATAAREIGRWGEALVYHYLMSRIKPSRKVLWVNKDEEGQTAYDLIVEESCAVHQTGSTPSTKTRTTFIEVKSTRFPDKNVFDISQNEWAFASAEPPLRYDIYRVYNAGDPNRVRITIVKDLYRQIKDQKVRLALVL